MLRIALAQINTTVGDLNGNRQKILHYCDKARACRADIVAFPELAVCGYPPEDLLFKEHFVRDTLKSLKTLAAKVKGLTAVVGFVDKDRDGHLFNAAACIADRRVRGVYHKQWLPNYGVFDERRYFKEGDDNLLVRFGPYPFGVTICEDIWQEDGPHHAQAAAGAQMLLNISASPYDFRKFEQRQRLLRRRARETKDFVCYVNLVGGQDELVFDGGSLIVDPRGRVLASGRQFEEDMIVADLPVPAAGRLKKSRMKQLVLRPALRPETRPPAPRRVPEKLGQDERILKALAMGTRDYVRKNRFEKVVVGLSGGIDSSLVAAVAVQAVGKDNVTGVSMPSRFSSPETKSDARRLAENLGIRFIEVPIEGILQAYTEVLAPAFAGRAPDITEENIQARIRGNILMALSNKFGWLVVTTGNKSEIAVGYCTLYGDLSGGFAVIKDVPKTKVYTLAGLINRQQGEVIPPSVLTRAPTAELRENQKDQDTLPSYDILDGLIKAYVEEHRSLTTIKKIVEDAGLIKKFIRMVDHSEYKRRQAPPGIKITPRAFGKDWRLPITHQYKEF